MKHDFKDIVEKFQKLSFPERVTIQVSIAMLIIAACSLCIQFYSVLLV